MNMKTEKGARPLLGRLGNGFTLGGRTTLLEVIQSLGLLTVIVICSIVLSFASPVFFTIINIENLLFTATIVAVVAIGQAFVILVAGIDLSVGAVLALSSVLAVGLSLHNGLPVPVAVAVTLVAGGGIGLINGLCATVLRIPPLIATLAMMSIARGAAFLYSGGAISRPCRRSSSKFRQRGFSEFLW